MRLSRAKINHLSHLVINALEKEPQIKLLKEKNDIRLKIKDLIIEDLKLDKEIDQFVRDKINSFARKIPEGSKEWEILYKKYFREESNKRRKAILQS